MHFHQSIRIQLNEVLEEWRELRKRVEIEEFSVAIPLRDDSNGEYESAPRTLSEYFKAHHVSDLDFSQKEEFSGDTSQSTYISTLFRNNVRIQLPDVLEELRELREFVKIQEFYDVDLVKEDNDRHCSIQTGHIETERLKNLFSTTVSDKTFRDQKIFHGFSENAIRPLPGLSPHITFRKLLARNTRVNGSNVPAVSARHIKANVVIRNEVEPLSFLSDFSPYKEMCHDDLMEVLYTLSIDEIDWLMSRAQHHFSLEITSLEEQHESIRKETAVQLRKRHLSRFFPCCHSAHDPFCDIKLRDIERALRVSKDRREYWKSLSDSLRHPRPKSGFPLILYRLRVFMRRVARSLGACFGRNS